MYPLWILVELRTMEVVVTTGAIRREKLQPNHNHQQTNIRLLTGRMPVLLLFQLCQTTEGKFTYLGKNYFGPNCSHAFSYKMQDCLYA